MQKKRSMTMKTARLKKGRVFYRYLFSYLLVLMIPTVLSIFLFRESRKILNSEVARANNLLLQQVKSNLDMVMADVLKMNFLVSYNDSLQSLLYETLPIDDNVFYYQSYSTVNDFAVYKLANGTILDFYIYLPYLDMILAPSGYHTSWNYYISRISRLGFSYSEWISGFQAFDKNAYITSKAETESGEVKNTLSMVSVLPPGANREKRRAWLVVHVDLSHFDRVLKNSVWSEKSLFLLYHESLGAILTSTLPVTLPQVERVLMSIHAGTDEEQVEIAGTPYVMLSRKSDVVNWSYISFVPLEVYSSRFTLLTHFTYMALGACALIGGVLIYWSAVTRYRPIHRILSMIRPDAEGNISLRSDELALITDSLKITLDEDRVLRKQVKDSVIVLQQRYLQQLLLGEQSFESRTREDLEKIGVRFDNFFIFLILMDIEFDEEIDPEVRWDIVKNIREPPVTDEMTVIRDLQGFVGFLVNCEGPSPEAVSDVLSAVKKRYENQDAVFPAVGVSDTHSLHDGLKVLYDEASLALEYRLVKGRHTPIYFHEVRNTRQSFYYPMEFENRLVNTIQVGDSEAAANLIADIYRNNFEGPLLSLEVARCLMFNLISTMIKTMNTLLTREADSEFWSKISPISRMMSCRSFEQLKVEMDDILERVCDYVKHGRKNRTEAMRDEITTFIQENYRNPNLSSDMISEHLGKNKAYLSRFFREQMSMGINSFIKRVRVAKAKQFLQDDRMTIGEIAVQVGFIGSNAFIRVYKEIEGVTPGQHKTSMIKHS